MHSPLGSTLADPSHRVRHTSGLKQVAQLWSEQRILQAKPVHYDLVGQIPAEVRWRLLRNSLDDLPPASAPDEARADEIPGVSITRRLTVISSDALLSRGAGNIAAFASSLFRPLRKTQKKAKIRQQQSNRATPMMMAHSHGATPESLSTVSASASGGTTPSNSSGSSGGDVGGINGGAN